MKILFISLILSILVSFPAYAKCDNVYKKLLIKDQDTEKYGTITSIVPLTKESLEEGSVLCEDLGIAELAGKYNSETIKEICGRYECKIDEKDPKDTFFLVKGNELLEMSVLLSIGTSINIDDFKKLKILPVKTKMQKVTAINYNKLYFNKEKKSIKIASPNEFDLIIIDELAKITNLKLQDGEVTLNEQAKLFEIFLTKNSILKVSNSFIKDFGYDLKVFIGPSNILYPISIASDLKTMTVNSQSIIGFNLNGNKFIIQPKAIVAFNLEKNSYSTKYIVKKKRISSIPTYVVTNKLNMRYVTSGNLERKDEFPETTMYSARTTITSAVPASLKKKSQGYLSYVSQLVTGASPENLAKLMESAKTKGFVGRGCDCGSSCRKYADLIVKYSRGYSLNGEILDPIFVLAVMMQESSCNKDICSHNSNGPLACGLMQVNIQARSFAQWRDPEVNIKKGLEIYMAGYNQCGKDLLKALSNYYGAGCKYTSYSNEVKKRYELLKAEFRNIMLKG